MTSPQTSQTTRTVAIVSGVVGGLVLLGLVGSAVIATAQSIARPEGTSHEVLSSPIDGVTKLSVDSHSARVTVRFDDISEAELEVSGDRANDWHLTNRDGVLRVDKHTGWLGGLCLFSCWGNRTDVTLTLPDRLNDGRLDARFDVASGETFATGSFSTVDIDIASGFIEFDGEATVFSGGIASGNARFTVDSPEEFNVDLASGNVDARVTGATPRTVELDVASGDLRVELPDDEYRYSQHVASGDVENQLRTSPSARASVHLELASGNATLTATR